MKSEHKRLVTQMTNAELAQVSFDAEKFYTEFRTRMTGDAWTDHDVATNHEHVEALEETVESALRERFLCENDYRERIAQLEDTQKELVALLESAVSDLRAVI